MTSLCPPAPPPAIVDATRPGRSAVIDREIEMNGPEMNGIWLSPLSRAASAKPPQGKSLQYVSLRLGIKLRDGSVVCDARMDGTALRAGARGPEAFVGAELWGHSTSGDEVRLRIDGVKADGPLYHYNLQWQIGTLAPQPLCEGGAAAVALPGRWDYRQGRPGVGGRRDSDSAHLTLACPNGALAKCVRMGYRPFAGAAAGADAETLYGACLRAIRADYCGDGISRTRSGVKVNFYDSAGIQKDGADWPHEADWSPAGAVCLNGEHLARAEKTQLRSFLTGPCAARFRRGTDLCIKDPAKVQPVLFTEVAP